MHGFAFTFASLTAVILACTAAADEGASSGQPRLDLPAEPYRYADVSLPRHFETPAAKAFDATPADNPITDAGAALGRALFYDVRLSANNSISCGSCHFQEHAFADPRRFSPGHRGVLVDRNAMSLVNLRFMRNGAFWDERAATLEQQALMPIESPVEMGAKLPEVVALLKADAKYPELFRAAFGEDVIDADRIGKALAQFVRSLVSTQSKYDDGAAQARSMSDDFTNFTAEENQGKSLFLARCAVCHRPARDTQLAHFDLFRSLNNGLDADATGSDSGQGDVTFDINQVGLFRASSLRNIEFTAPYMHDGRFATLEEVVEHYSTGVARHPTVSGNIFRMQFSAAEKQAVVAFLKTLSDERFLADPRFADPWVWPGRSPNRLPASALPVASSLAPKPAAASWTAEDREEWLAAGKGLPAAETLPWLQGLDADADGKLSPHEYRPVVERLAESDAILRTEELETNPLARRNRPLPSEGDHSPQAVAAADFNGDGKLDPQEARQYALFKQFIELRDGGRLESRLDGLLSNFSEQLPGERFAEARACLQAGKRRVHQERLGFDAELLQQIRELLTPEEFVEFQHSALNDYGNTSGRSSVDRTEPAAVEATLREYFQRFDRNGDGVLDESELNETARALNELPGGFGQRRGDGANLEQFTVRLLAFGKRPDEVRLDELPDRLIAFMTPADGDQNGVLARQEVVDFARNEGFRQLSEHGIYIGGGFEGIYSRVKLEELGLSKTKRESLQALLDAYAERLASLHDESIAKAYAELRSYCATASASEIASPLEAGAGR